MTEREFQTIVLNLFKLYGWHTAHFGNTIKFVRTTDGHKVIPDRDAAGFPDIVAVKGDRLIFVELKRKGGRVTESQRLWLDLLGKAEKEVYIWYPSDLDSITKTLSTKPS